MRIQADEMLFHLNLTKVSEHLQAWYMSHKDDMSTIQREDGRTIDFSRKSIARLALKAALVPFALPALRMLYAMRGAEIPPHDKHEDLIDYSCMALLGFLKVLDGSYIYVETLEGAGHDSRSINSISTHEPNQIGDGGGQTGRGEEETETLSTGGEAYLYSGQNGYGQDQIDEGSNQEKS